MTNDFYLKIESIMASIPEIVSQLKYGSNTYDLMAEITKISVANSGFAKGSPEQLPGIGTVSLPYKEMGAISTLDLFGIDELILFSFYALNSSRYRRAADLGANVGLHSIVMARCGWAVDSYEADPELAKIAENNLKLNGIEDHRVFNKAVSSKSGTVKFVRVLGNWTGSHIAGEKNNPYGELENFTVESVDVASIMRDVDFMKMDIEGSEARVIASTNLGDWVNTDVMLEIGSRENAELIFSHLTQIGVSMYSQKNGWAQVEVVDGLPCHHSEGSVFCSTDSPPQWKYQ